jgi:hypothetical protein
MIVVLHRDPALIAAQASRRIEGRQNALMGRNSLRGLPMRDSALIFKRWDK